MKPNCATSLMSSWSSCWRSCRSRCRTSWSEVPLVVEDYPSREVMRRMRVRHPAHLCGLYTGIPLIKRSVEHSGVPSDVIHIYRLGILEPVARGATAGSTRPSCASRFAGRFCTSMGIMWGSRSGICASWGMGERGEVRE